MAAVAVGAGRWGRASHSVSKTFSFLRRTKGVGSQGWSSATLLQVSNMISFSFIGRHQAASCPVAFRAEARRSGRTRSRRRKPAGCLAQGTRWHAYRLNISPPTVAGTRTFRLQEVPQQLDAHLDLATYEEIKRSLVVSLHRDCLYPTSCFLFRSHRQKLQLPQLASTCRS